ncbi:MAG: alpha-2-macroglobulin family protein [bacterium]
MTRKYLLSAFFLTVPLLSGSAFCAGGLEKADSLFGKKLYQEAMAEYDSVSKKTGGTARLKAAYRSVECRALLFRYLEAAERILGGKFPADPIWKARFLILRAETARKHIQQYGFASPSDAEEGASDLSRRTKEEWHRAIASDYSLLRGLRSRLIDVPIKDEGYFIDLSDADKRITPTLWDFVVMRWTDYLLTEAPSGETGKPDPMAFIAKRFKIPFSASDQPAVTAGAVLEEAQAMKTEGRQYASESWRLKRLLIPFTGPDLTAPFKDRTAATASAVSVLKGWMKSFRSADAAARAAFEAARMLNVPGKYRDAAETCRYAVKNFPGTAGAAQCKKLRSEIEFPSLDFNARTAPPPASGAFSVKTRNLPAVYFRIYRTTPEELRSMRPGRDEGWNALRYPSREMTAVFLARKADYSFSIDMTPAAPHEYAGKKAVPPPMTPGIYLALACGDDDFRTGESLLRAAITDVTSLFLVGTAGLSGTEREFTPDPDSDQPLPALHSFRTVRAEGFHLYAVNALTGLPVPDAKIESFKRQHGNLTERKILYTDANGMAGETTDAKLRHGRYSSGSLDSLASSGDSFAYWARPLSFHFSAPAPVRIFIETDRPVYRPGQEVSFKVTAIKRVPSGYRTYAGPAVLKIRAADAGGQDIFTAELSPSHMGTASSHFAIPQGRLLGNYQLYASLSAYGDTFRAFSSFSVEEYKRPEFELKLAEAMGAWKYGKPAKVGGEAAYYFGAPVPGADVTYRVYRQNYIPWFCWWWRGTDNARTEVASGSVKTGADGKFSFSFIPSAPRDGSGYPSRFHVEAEAHDPGGRTITAYSSYTAGEKSLLFDISMPSGFATAGKPYDIPVRLVNLNEKAVAGSGTWELWKVGKSTAVREDGIPLRGRLSGDVPLETLFADAAAYEKAASGSLKFRADRPSKAVLAGLASGIYRFTVKTRDPWGGLTEASVIVPVVNASGKTAGLDLPAVAIPEHETYLEGEKARILLGSSLVKGRTFVEIWGGRFLLDRKLISPGVQVLEMPVTADHKGGFSVRWFAAGDFQIKSGEALVHVPWKEKELRLFLKHDKSLAPGQKAQWNLEAKDYWGQPVDAEGTIRIFDRSLEYYASSGASWLDSLYPERRGNTSLLSSLLSHYSIHLPVETGMLRKMAETVSAFIKEPVPPGLRMDRSSYSHYGISRSRGGFSEARFARSKSIQDDEEEISGSAAPVLRVPQAVRAAAAAPSGTGKKQLPEVKTRTDFSETAYFQPHLKIAAGQGPFSFKIPERLTSWKVTASAFTQDLKKASISTETVTVKDLMVRVEMPRFLREGDKSVIKAVINNSTDRPLSGSADISVSMDGMPSDTKLLPESGARQFTVPPKGVFTASWEAFAPRKIVSYKVRAIVRSGKLADAEERELPILPSRQRLMETGIAALDGTGRTKLEIKAFKKKDPSRQNEAMHLQIDPQLALSVLNSLPFLINYPYECTEQLVNRYVPLSISNSFYRKYPALAEAVKKIPKRTVITPQWDRSDPRRMMSLMETPWESISKGRASAPPATDMLNPAVVAAQKADAMAKLRERQLFSGAFPWFLGGKPDLYITLVVLEGLAEAAKYGVEIPEETAKRALAWVNAEIHKYMKPETAHVATLLYAAWTATSFPKSWTESKQAHKLARTWIDYADRHSDAMTAYGKAYAAYIYMRIGEKAKADSYLDRAMDGARQDPVAGVYWTPEKLSWLWYNDSVEMHSFILRTLLTLRPKDKRIPGMVQWLLFNRKGSEWKSTKSSAKAVYSLLDVLKTRGALDKGDSFRVDWGGDIKLAEVQPFDWLEKPLRWSIPGPEVTASRASAVINKKGPGLAFASLTWLYSTDKLPESSGKGMMELERKFFLRYKEGNSWRLRPLAAGETVSVGDQVEVHLAIKTRSQFEYVHLKDPRGAGFEAEELRSGWKWDKLSRYEEPRDSLTNFFMNRLPHGEYVLTYRMRPATPGTYKIGAAVLQSMYAPEMSAHSEGFVLNVKE